MFNLQEYNKGNDVKAIGCMTWWTVFEKRASYDAVVDAIKAVGLNPDFLRKPAPKSAFQRAANDESNGVTFYRKIVNDKNRLVLGHVQENVEVEAELLNYEQTAKVSFHKEDSTVEVEGDTTGRFLEKYNENLASVEDQDIRAFILATIGAEHGVSMRKTGGIYFIPNKNTGRLEALSAFLENTGFGLLYVIRIPDGKGERSVTWDSFTKECDERLSTIVEKVGAISRVGCLARHEDSVQEVSLLLDTYAGLCDEEEKLEAIRAKINETQAKIVERTSVLNKAKEDNELAV